MSLKIPKQGLTKGKPKPKHDEANTSPWKGKPLVKTHQRDMNVNRRHTGIKDGNKVLSFLIALGTQTTLLLVL